MITQLVPEMRLEARRRAYALIKLPHPPFRHSRIVTSVNFGDVVSFDVLVCGVHCEEPRKGDLQKNIIQK